MNATPTITPDPSENKWEVRLDRSVRLRSVEYVSSAEYPDGERYERGDVEAAKKFLKERYGGLRVF